MHLSKKSSILLFFYLSYFEIINILFYCGLSVCIRIFDVFFFFWINCCLPLFQYALAHCNTTTMSNLLCQQIHFRLAYDSGISPWSINIPQSNKFFSYFPSKSQNTLPLKSHWFPFPIHLCSSVLGFFRFCSSSFRFFSFDAECFSPVHRCICQSDKH